MKMNRGLNWVNTLVLLGAALCWSASQGSAQSAIRGEFSLPVEAHWGGAVLPAGEYSFNLQSVRAPEVVQIRGEGRNVLIMAQGASDVPTSSNSALVLAQNGASHVVRSLRLAPLGITLHYAPHKGGAHNMAMMAPERAQQVPVRVNGK